MSQSFSDFNVDQLTLPERLELITRLWDSLPDDLAGMPVPDWHLEELKRRLEAAEKSPQASIPWEEARRQLRGEA